MKVKIKRLTEDAVIPKKAHLTDAGFDLYASRTEINDRGHWVCHSDISLEIPQGYVGLLFPRSSICKTSLSLTNGVGVIDAGYRGEITAEFRQTGFGLPYNKGDRFAQLIIIPFPEIEFEEVDELSKSDREGGGYGSTGR
ncbi:MAG: dUTP diphosphatase [Muribaculaceae bacterium]|nr:dUTP diphosphatase [Muribaculaceae bacterium]